MAEQPADSAPIMLTVTRVFPVSPEVLFQAWLDPKSLGSWLFATPTGEMQKVTADPRVGGEFLVVEKRGDVLAEHFGQYVEFDPPRRLVFAFATNREAKPTRVTVEFTPVLGGCRLTLSHEMDPQWASFTDRARAGWTMILASLSRTFTRDRELILSRTFPAPRELVYQVWTQPEHVAQWWGPNGFTTTSHAMEVRPGGVWRYRMHGPEGTDYPNKIEFVEVLPNVRLVYWHGDDGESRRAPFFVTTTFDDDQGQTKLTLHMVCESAAALAEIKPFGAVEGGELALQRLADYLARQIS